MNKCVREVKDQISVVTRSQEPLIETHIDVLSIDEIIVSLVNSKYSANIMNANLGECLAMSSKSMALCMLMCPRMKLN